MFESTSSNDSTGQDNGSSNSTTETWLMLVNTVNLALIVLLIVAGFQIIMRYILRLGICMTFVNLFYILSSLLLLVDLTLVFSVYFELPSNDMTVDMSADIPLNVFTVANSVHSVIYTALVLLMVSAMFQIATGLKLTYYSTMPT